MPEQHDPAAAGTKFGVIEDDTIMPGVDLGQPQENPPVSYSDEYVEDNPGVELGYNLEEGFAEYLDMNPGDEENS